MLNLHYDFRWCEWEFLIYNELLTNRRYRSDVYVKPHVAPSLACNSKPMMYKLLEQTVGSSLWQESFM